MATQLLRWQFTVVDFARKGEAGIFTEDDRVELIDGEVIAISPIGPKEEKLPRYAQGLIPEVWMVDIEPDIVSRYTQPDGYRYTGEQALERGHDIVSPTLNALQLTVKQIFG